MKSDATMNEKAAYTAGIIDGEGSIQIRKNHYKTAAGIKESYCLRVRVVNTDKVLIDWLVRVYGGNTYEDCRKASKNEKHLFDWNMHSNAAYSFLQQVYPFLVIKRKQAQVAFDFMCREWYDTGESHYVEMRELNRKGVSNA